MSNGSAKAKEPVDKLWRASRSLQGGGVSYQDYVTELTFLLFLKMLEEQKREDKIPEHCRWSYLKKQVGEELLLSYRQALLDLGSSKTKAISDGRVRQIFTDAQTSLTEATSLSTLVETIDQIDWYSLEDDGIGDLYEGLLERTASERKSKAGQYFTPRPLIDCMVRLVKPQAGELIQDPAAGTGGFLIAAQHYVRQATDGLTKLKSAQAKFQREGAFSGLELIVKTHRLCLMNMMLHGIDAGVNQGDALSARGAELPLADVILTNPPFNKFPEKVARQDFVLMADTAKGPLPFLEHVVRKLKPGGRGAIVVPDGTLGNGEGGDLRKWMLDLCDVHTILRLPTGIFYAQGVKTNVVFLTRGKTEKGSTKATWVYDMRAGQPAFGKTRILSTADFADFEKAYGDDPLGKSKRKDQGEEGRFRKFTREEVAKRNDNLDISWLREDDASGEEELTDPEDIAAAIMGHLRAALAEIESVSLELSGDAVELAT